MTDDELNIIRSAYSIAIRNGEETNWEAFRNQLKRILDNINPDLPIQADLFMVKDEGYHLNLALMKQSLREANDSE